MSTGTDRFEVMFFLPQLGGGGAEMNAVRLAPGLLAAGITPVYVVARGPGRFSEFLPDGVREIILDTGRINSSTLRLIRARRPLSRLIDARRPDVLCVPMISPTLAALSALKHAEHRPAIIFSMESSLSVTHGTEATLRTRCELWAMRRTFHRVDAVIAKTNGIAHELRQSLPDLADRIIVLPNIAMPDADMRLGWDRSKNPDQRRRCTILACGRLTKPKDYPTLLHAFALLSGRDLRLEIVGEGPLLESLQHRSRELGIADRVTFHGFQRDPFSHMRRADIFVLSSLWEGFGMVLVEAMAMGTPVVSTNCPHGPAEIIRDGESGLLVPMGQPEELAAALQRLIDDPSLRQRLGQAGQVRARDFTAERVGAEYARRFQAIRSTTSAA